MATSGTTTFTVTRDQIIEAALRSLSVLEEGAQPSATTLENSSFSLNLILKKWQSEGMKIWTIKEVLLVVFYDVFCLNQLIIFSINHSALFGSITYR